MRGLLKRWVFAAVLSITPPSVGAAQTLTPTPAGRSDGTPSIPSISTSDKHVSLPVLEQPHPKPQPGSPEAHRPRPNLAAGQRMQIVEPSLVSVPVPVAQGDMPNLVSTSPVGGAWTELGPKPIVGERCCGGTPGTNIGNASGRVSSLAVAANNTAILYAGAAGGGVWKSVNGGNSWIPLTDGQISLATGSVATDPTGGAVYVGTGEDNGSDSQFGQGILVSSNGGANWTTTGQNTFAGAHIGGMAVDRTNISHAWAASDLGLYQTTNSGGTWTVNTAVNTGITAVGSGPFAVRQIIQDPQSAATLWATLSDSCTTEYGDIALSTDGGASWHAVFDVYAASGGQAAGRISLGVGSNGVAYASFADCNGDLLAIERTANYGGNWQSLNGGSGLINYFNLGSGGQGTYDTTVAVDSTNGNTAVFGGVTLLATHDGGATFQNIGNVYGEASNPGGFIHPDFHALVFTTANTFYAGNDGGIWKTTDLGGTGSAGDWTNLNATLNTIQFYNGTALDTSHLLGGAQDNGSAGNLAAGGATLPHWPEYHGGDGAYTAIDPTSGSSTIYAEYPFLGIEKGSSAINGGDPNSPYDSFTPAAPCSSGGEAACNDPSGFTSPFAMDPSNPHRLLSGTNRVYQSVDDGAPGSWTALSGDLTLGTVGTAHDFISALSVGPPGATNVIFTGSNFGAVQMTTNGGGSWTNITGNLPAYTAANYVFPISWVTGVAFNPSNPQEAWVTLGAVGIHHVWHTLSAGAAGGTTWSTLDGSGGSALLNMITSSVVVDPRQPGQIYISSYYGAWVCQACSGQTPAPSWSPLGTGLPNVFVAAVTLTRDQSSLIAWTHGRGAYSLPLPPVNTTAPITNLVAPVRDVDTRSGIGGFTGQITPGTDRCFTLGGINGVPNNATGVVVNLTAVGQATIGWLTLYPAGQALPSSSTLNFDPNQYAIANGAIVRLGTNNQVCVDAGNAPAYAVIDVTGYLTPGGASSLTLLTNSVRLVDTRSGVGGYTGLILPGVDRCFTLAGLSGIPADAAGVVLNLSAVGYTANGWLTLYPNGQPLPSTSSVNFDPHQYAIANSAILELGTNGMVCVHAGANPSYALLDVAGYVTSTGLTQIPVIAPVRAVDTRFGIGGATGPIQPGADQCFTIAGTPGVPANASTVIVNLTATGYPASGWLTLYPNGQVLPATSTLNFDAREYAIANSAIMRIGTSGKVCLNAGQNVSQAIIDVTGYEP